MSAHTRSALVLAALLTSSVAAAPTFPVGFASLPIGGSFVNPTGLAFIAPGKLLVCEKRGTVQYIENDFKKNQVIDLSLEALDNGDRGLLGVAPDPDFANNGWMYLLMIVDPNQDGVDSEQFAFCRLVRYQTVFQPNGDLVANLGTRQVLLGATWTTAIPSCHFSHAIGNVRFLSDGSLVLTAGDGAHYDLTDSGGFDAPCFGPGALSTDQDIGAFRSVYLNSFSGKVLRLDRNTGLGLPDNPFYTGNPNDIRSRVWAMGLRNPYRFTLLPGSGGPAGKEKLLISDVGWNDWEELNVCAGGENFGWPCFEGAGQQNSYQNADPGGFCATVNHAPPLLAWNHASNGSLGFKGNCATGAAIYTGSQFPPIYQGALFYCDYGQSWIRYLRLGASGQIVSNQPFATKAGSPVALEMDPSTGELVLASLENGGTVARIRYVGSTAPPVAIASATPPYGPAPLTVQFKGSDSTTVGATTLAYSWNFGDGTSSTAADPLKSYGAAGSFTATLTVTNGFGFSSNASVLVTPGNTPPQIVNVRLPKYGKKYKGGDTILLNGKAFDTEDAVAQLPLDVSWHVDLIHEEHVHPDFAMVQGATGSFVAQPHGDASYYLCRFIARDSFGLVSESAIPIYDIATVPSAEIEAVSDSTPRLGHGVSIDVKMFYPGAVAPDPLPALSINWGDGSPWIALSNVAHLAEHSFPHLYTATGSYTVRVRATIAGKSSEATTGIEVIPAKPAVAIFTPLLAQKWVPWNSQQAIAQSITSAVAPLGGGTEVLTFSASEQQALVAWMTPYLDDGVRDVLVIMDYAPAATFAGEIDGSLAEEWLDHGNGIVWTGFQPFFSYVDAAGIVSSYFASVYGGDFIFDAPLLALLTNGSGAQVLKPLAATEVPSLIAYTPGRAFKYTKLIAPWSLDRLYADSASLSSDALVIRHTSGGFFAEFFCVETEMPRAAVISEFLKAYVTGP